MFDALADLRDAETIAKELDDRLLELEILVEQSTVLDHCEDFAASKHVADLAREAGITRDTPFSEGIQKMKPHSEALVRWIYAQVVERCRARGVVPMAAYIPHMSDLTGQDELIASKARQMELAREAGMVVLDLTNAYEGVDARTLWIAPWDSHPDAEGHRMLGEELYDQLKVQLAL